MRSVVRFLDKDSSGTIDVGEIDKAVREFRELVRDTPSLGTGPMTIIDSVEIDRLARRTFADLVAKYSSVGKDGETVNADADADTTITTTNNNDGKDNKTDENANAAGYTTGREGGDDVQFLPAVTAGTPPKAEKGPAAAGGEAGEGDADSDGGDHDEERQQPQQTVSASETSTAFADALRQFKTGGEGQHSGGAMRRMGAQQPSTDTQHAKVYTRVGPPPP